MDDKQLLAEVDSVLAQMPKITEFASLDGPGNAWLGRANAVLSDRVDIADKTEINLFNRAIEQGQYLTVQRPDALRGFLRLLHKVRHQLLMATGGTGTVAIDQGMHFQYFDALKNLVQTATSDLLLVDPYLNEEVLSKFCIFAKNGVSIRLLAQRYTTTLQPAAAALNQQRGGVYLRKSDDVHDRFVFVDKSKCHLSGASFKDGPKYAPSILTEIVDGVPQLLSLYEARWDAATVLI